MNSQANESWNLLDTRQFEIMDALVSDAMKAAAFDRVLWEIDRIHPRSNTYYCRALERRLQYTSKNDDVALKRIAEDAFRHRNKGSDLCDRIIAGAYLKAKRKSNIPNAKVARDYLNKIGREEREISLAEITRYLEADFYDPGQKINRVEEALDILAEEKYFGPVKSNELKRYFCKEAVRICREELYDNDSANYYLLKAEYFDSRADTAKREWARRRGMWTNAQEQAFLAKHGGKRR
jgi:hypothetical protein